MSARACMSTPSNDAVVIGCTEMLFQPSSLCCLRTMRRSTRRLRYGVAEKSTMRSTESDSVQTERVLTRLVVHSPSPRLPSVSQAMKRMLHTIHEVIVSSSVVFSCVPRTLTWSTFGFTLRAKSLKNVMFGTTFTTRPPNLS